MAVAEHTKTTADDIVVGPRVKALREAMGLSLRDLAERSSVSAPMLSQVERGETSPTLSVAAKIARGLDLSLSQLLRLDESHHVVIVAKDAAGLKEKLVSDAFSPIKYDGNKPQALLDEDKDIRYIYKQFPILSETSYYAARAALA